MHEFKPGVAITAMIVWPTLTAMFEDGECASTPPVFHVSHCSSRFRVCISIIPSVPSVNEVSLLGAPASKSTITGHGRHFITPLLTCFAMYRRRRRAGGGSRERASCCLSCRRSPGGSHGDGRPGQPSLPPQLPCATLHSLCAPRSSTKTFCPVLHCLQQLPFHHSFACSLLLSLIVNHALRQVNSLFLLVVYYQVLFYWVSFYQVEMGEDEARGTQEVQPAGEAVAAPRPPAAPFNRLRQLVRSNTWEPWS